MAKLCQFEAGITYAGRIDRVGPPSNPILNRSHPPIYRLYFQVFRIGAGLVAAGYATALLIIRKNCKTCQTLGIGPRAINCIDEFLPGRWYKLVFDEAVGSQRQAITIIGHYRLRGEPHITGDDQLWKIAELCEELEVSATKMRRLFDEIKKRDHLAAYRTGSRRDRVAFLPRFARELEKIDPALAALLPGHLLG